MQHLRPQRPFILDLRGTINEREHATPLLIGRGHKPGHADDEMAAADAATIMPVELRRAVIGREKGMDVAA
jgi:hypothetical protein